jgi:hypothetical protein
METKGINTFIGGSALIFITVKVKQCFYTPWRRLGGEEV